MGSICAKLCPWFFKKNPENIDIEMQDQNNVANYNLLKEDDIIAEDIDHVKIRVSKFVFDKESNPFENYQQMEILGSGTFGVVYKVIHKHSKLARAMKIIKKDNLDVHLDVSELEAEINILKNLDHPNILKIYEFYHDDENYYILTDLCESGDLSRKLKQMKTMDESVVKTFMYQIISSVSYLHSKNVIHGDLKLENIMIENINNDQISNNSNEKDNTNLATHDLINNYEIKLIDFGHSKLFIKGKSKLSGIIGTPLYCSPEVFENTYNQKCDNWACGVIMYFLLAGRPPFDGKNEEEIYNNIMKKSLDFKFKNKISQEAKDLIEKLLVVDLENRISIGNALNHDFFKEIRNQKVSNSKKIIWANSLKQLKTIKTNTKFKQAALTYITYNYADRDETNKLRKLFKYIDKNGDGVISKNELMEAYDNFKENISEEDLNKIIKALDNDDNGSIEYEEFLRASLNRAKLLTNSNIKFAFELFDLDKSGQISVFEMKKVIFGEKDIPNHLIEEFMAEMNKSVYDLITIEDFKTIMLKDEKII